LDKKPVSIAREIPVQGPDWVGFWKLILIGQQRRLAAEAKADNESFHKEKTGTEG